MRQKGRKSGTDHVFLRDRAMSRRAKNVVCPCFFWVKLAYVDLDAPVERLVDVVLSRHDRLALAAAGGADALGGGDALGDELRLHALGTRERELVVRLLVA